LAASGCLAPDQIYFNASDPSGEVDPDVAAEEGDNVTIDQANENTKIYTDSGKTVFANWSMVDPGQTAVIVFKYELPFKLENKIGPIVEKPGLEGLIDKMVKTENKDLLVYSLLVQKQPGSLSTTINSTLSLADDFKVDWNYPANLTVGLNGWQTSEKLNSDKYWAAIIEKSAN
jgi:hypothetical protein